MGASSGDFVAHKHILAFVGPGGVQIQVLMLDIMCLSTELSPSLGDLVFFLKNNINDEICDMDFNPFLNLRHIVMSKCLPQRGGDLRPLVRESGSETL